MKYIVSVSYPTSLVTYDTLEEASKAARELAANDLFEIVTVVSVEEVLRFAKEAPPSPEPERIRRCVSGRAGCA